MDWAELAADIAVEGEQAMYLNTQIHDIDERIANLYADADPSGIVTSAPGVGPSSPPSSPAASATRTDSPAWPRSAPTAASSRR